MTRHIEETVNRYVEELRKQHPGLTVELLDGHSKWVDARLRVRCGSHEQIDNVMETVAHLTTKFYLDEGVYITASASLAGAAWETNPQGSP